MQRAVNKVLVAMIILLMALSLCGCGSEDLLEENNQRYKTHVIFSDAEEDDTLAADIIYVTDCNGDGTPDDPETFTDLYAIITITIDETTTPGLEMTGYEISFRPLRSYDQAGNPVTPPSVGTYWGNFDVNIESNSEETFWITCMEADQKLYIGTFLNALDWVFRYEVTINMHFVDDLDEARDITIVRTLYFGSYNNC